MKVHLVGGARVTEEAFRFRCVIAGFDLAAFDEWLEALGPCGAKRELRARRELALEGMRANNNEQVLRHLEWLHLRRMMIESGDAEVRRFISLRQSGIAKKPRKLTEEMLATIRRRFLRLQANGQERGAITAIATAEDLHPDTVSAAVRDLGTRKKRNTR